MNPTLEHHPLGAPIPASPHAVCASLPTLDAVIGYEEKRPDVMQALTQGYPRFVRHPWVKAVLEQVAKENGLPPECCFPVSSVQAAQRMSTYAGAPAQIITDDDVTLACFPAQTEVLRRAGAYQQHTGCLISSRQAEDILIRRGLRSESFTESVLSYSPEARIKNALRAACPMAAEVVLTRSGMSAGYAAIRAAAELQLERGRTVWIQLGWLYLDTQRTLENLLPAGARCVKAADVYDLEALRAIIEAAGDQLAGLVTEVPTNPLVQTADIETVSNWVRKHGGLCIFDPTLVSLLNVDALPWADVQVTSLTKYAAWNGDVMAGALMLNPDSPCYDELALRIPTYVEAPYPRDLERLAFQIQHWQEHVSGMNRNTMRLARYLESHPAVRTVYWAYDPESAPHYKRLSGSEEKPGAMLTLVLNQPCQSLFDPACFAKGPSFGTIFTLLCPFMYLAHYELVNNPEGRAHLRAQGVEPELLRLSCGCEPYEQIQHEFERLLSIAQT